MSNKLGENQIDAHGNFYLDLKGNILCVEIMGAWNVEAMQACAAAVAPVVAPLAGQKWASIFTIDYWEFPTPDTKKLGRKLIIQGAQFGLTREAIVCNEGLLKIEVIERNTPNIPDFIRKFFKTKQEAIVWLAEEGFDYL